MAQFVIKRVLKGSYEESKSQRKVTVVDAPNAMKALRRFAGNRPAILRPGRTVNNQQEWVASILTGNPNASKRRVRDYVATSL